MHKHARKTVDVDDNVGDIIVKKEEFNVEFKILLVIINALTQTNYVTFINFIIDSRVWCCIQFCSLFEHILISSVNRNNTTIY